ncbi:GDSL-type esterase/lipase family protein [Corynebacterium freneyi]|uniref:GDSL-type esterase/lipase family protein n=1 Tax=Corynebacterium freneyi TaxID=134034 RepID=UPI001CD0270B|nr:GDSL-type esterase/lipase family protein [Corynebacterium freneyi]UBI01170.1 GDSL-type esterase/lipase family protein [Corynebacterium freneyi]
MTKRSVCKRALSVVGVAGLVVASAFVAPHATASPAGNYVAFGDSYPADAGQMSPVEVGAGGCAQSVRNISRLVANQVDLELRDYTCNGTVVFVPTAKFLNNQVDAAVNSGALDSDTKLVTLLAGANDAFQASWTPTTFQDEAFHGTMVMAVEKIQQAAPNAKIMIVGYPEFTARDGSHYGCPVNVFGLAPRVSMPTVNAAENAVQHRQMRAAAETGVLFLNMKDRSNVEAGMCAPDGERNVSAVIDSDVSQYNMGNHLTFKGSGVFADAIVEAYRG